MNIFSALFGIFRQRGLVAALRENRPLRGFVISAGAASMVGGVLYGFAMGIGFGPETAIRDAIKAGLIVLLGVLFSLPIFWLAYRLLGREERAGQVAAVPLTFVATASIVLAATAPVVFLLSLLAGFSPEGIYIHIVIIDLALLVGFYLAGTLIYHGFTAERGRLIVPNVISFLMLGVILVVLALFFSPFLALRPTFSVGTDLLKGRLGIGVEAQATRALAAASAADRLTYRFQTTNENGDLQRDYVVTRAGDDYGIQVVLHAVPGEPTQAGRNVWLIDGQAYTDFDDGRVAPAEDGASSSFLEAALPAAAFRLPDGFAAATWRGFESGAGLAVIGTTPALEQATLTLEASTLRLSGLVIGSADRSLHSEVRVTEVSPAALDRADLQGSLDQAMVLGSVDRSDASMQDYVQAQVFFVLRFPRNWRAGNWEAGQQQVGFAAECGTAAGCSALRLSVFDLAEDKGPLEYAQDLAASLSRQPEFREITASTREAGGSPAGVVEYLTDRLAEGEVSSLRHVEYIFAGRYWRYHLDFSAPEAQFEANRSLFEAMAGTFTYLRP